MCSLGWFALRAHCAARYAPAPRRRSNSPLRYAPPAGRSPPASRVRAPPLIWLTRFARCAGGARQAPALRRRSSSLLRYAPPAVRSPPASRVRAPPLIWLTGFARCALASLVHECRKLAGISGKPRPSGLPPARTATARRPLPTRQRGDRSVPPLAASATAAERRDQPRAPAPSRWWSVPGRHRGCLALWRVVRPEGCLAAPVRQRARRPPHRHAAVPPTRFPRFRRRC